jgi:hypothetical protein
MNKTIQTAVGIVIALAALALIIMYVQSALQGAVP